MEPYTVYEKDSYVLVTLGSPEHRCDRDLPLPESVEELGWKKRVVLDITELESMSSPILSYVMTRASNSPGQRADVIDSNPKSKNITLDNLLIGVNLRKFVNIFSSVEDYEKKTFR